MKNFPPDFRVWRALPLRRVPAANARAQRVLAPGAIALAVFTLGIPLLYCQAPAPASADNAAKTAPAKTGATKVVTTKVAAIKSFRIIQEKSGPALEILSTNPLVPAIQQISDPVRLVIDLPNARLDTPNKRVSVQADQITTIRADQFQQNPPVARVVLDLLAPREYTWDAAGNRLVIHLGRNPGEASHSPFQPASVPTVMPTAQAVVKAVRAGGPLAIASDAGNVGSSFTAGADTAILRLSSGGEVRVCPGTTVSITPSQNKHNLLLGMNTGALEAHMQLDASSDSVMTPDFRIMLVGPGEFHYAFSADNQGNTCVRSLPGNTASAIVTELLGDRTYQVKATDQLVFRGGQLDRIDMAVPLECGCPPPRQTMQQATNELPVQSAAANGPKQAASTESPMQVTITPASAAPATGVPAPDPAAQPAMKSEPPNELHVQIEAPLVFHASGPPPAPVEDVRALPPATRPPTPPELAVTPAPPPAQNTRPAGAETASADRPHGFFHKLGKFFSSIFR